ncbi:transposase [Actinacidiphila oryziradicis]|uniref:transposase n=1 Tax=Actinacidiphila oryziradicis TaxID=2571141 RepID=UPI0023F1B906|nr:transposase [Actinacidiphila oryziradicis]MCW2871117.1 Transposase [Actinacidiphila oryziradicis]
MTCPNGVTAPIERDARGDGAARFGAACVSCPLAAQCTTAGGRTVTVSRHEERLARARANSADPAWQADYRATRPKVERKIAHLMRRRHGGRRARMRGREKIAADFSLLAAAVNIARLGVLAIVSTGSGNWVIAAG